MAIDLIGTKEAVKALASVQTILNSAAPLSSDQEQQLKHNTGVRRVQQGTRLIRQGETSNSGLVGRTGRRWWYIAKWLIMLCAILLNGVHCNGI